MKQLVVVLFLLIILFIPHVVFAQESMLDSSPSGSLDLPEVKEDEYMLPYPGLLPDNPLYVIKAARDNLIGLLITDPKKKAEFDLLQADKRLQAGVFLIQKSQKYELAQQTISKSENYFEEAISKTRQAKNQGLGTSDIEDRLVKAAKKHEDMILSLEKNAPKEKKGLFTTIRERIAKINLLAKQLINNRKVK